MACFERCALSLVRSTLAFARTLRLSTLLPEPNELRFIAVFNDDSVRLAARMVRRTDGFIKARKRMATTLDRHLRLGAERSCDRFFSTGLPVLSDLIAMIGSPLAPRLVTVPPVGPLML